MAFTQQESFQTYAHTTGSEYPINGFYFLYNESIKCRIYKADGTYDDLVYGETADYIVDRKTVYRKSTWSQGLLLIYRENEYEQTTSYKNAEVVFDREQLERQLDYITMLVQQNKDMIDRAIITPLFDDGLMILPFDTQRYGKFMTFDQQGNIIIRYLTTNDFGAVSISWNSLEDSYTTGHLVEYGEDLWIAVVPVTGSPPDLTRPAEWKRFLIDNESIEEHEVLMKHMGPDAHYVFIWYAHGTYFLDNIINYNGVLYKCKVASATVGTPPSDTSTEWDRWTEKTSESITSTATIVAGMRDHTVFADTTSDPAYQITLEDGIINGDTVTVATFGDGEVLVAGTGLTDQTQTNNAIQYIWSGTAWLPLGGGSSGGGSGVNLGEVTWWPAATSTPIPDGKLVADGSVVNIADYPQLFGRIGITWGGDGSTTFGLPNLQGIFPGALGTQDINGNPKGDGTAVVGDYKEDQMQQITGEAFVNSGDFGIVRNYALVSGAFGISASDVQYSMSSADTNNGRGLAFDSANSPNARTGDYTDVSRAIGQWLIQAEPPAPSEVNAVVVDIEVGDVRWIPHETISIYDWRCLGQTMNISEYPELYAKLGTRWGGDGVTTFNLPNLQGIFPGAMGTQDINGNTKGDASAVVGDYKEDQAQLIEGNVAMGGLWNPYQDSAVEGVLKVGTSPGHLERGKIEDGSAWSNLAIAIDSSITNRTGDYTDVSRAIGQWVIRAKQPATYHIPDISEAFPPVKFYGKGDPLLEGELIGDGTTSLVSSAGRVPLAANVEIIPGKTYQDGSSSYDPMLKWEGHAVYGVFGDKHHKWQYGMDWALSSQWTVEGWFYNTGDTSHTDYINIFHTAIGAIDERWTIYFSPGERILRLYSMTASGGTGLVLGSPPVGWNHVKILWESATRMRASLNGASYVQITTKVVDTADCNKIVTLGSFGDDTGYFNSYLTDWTAHSGIDDSHAHYLKNVPYYDTEKIYGQDSLWSISKDGNISAIGLFNMLMPIGYQYIQRFGKPSPVEMGWFGTWEDKSADYAGQFFRVEGGEAGPFDGSVQEDQFQGFQIGAIADETGPRDLYQRAGSRDFGSEGQAVPNQSRMDGGTDFQGVPNSSIPVNNGTNGTPRTGNETRPINQTIRIWERTA